MLNLGIVMRLSTRKDYNDLDTILRRATPFSDTYGRTYARIPTLCGPGTRNVPVRSPEFRSWFYAQTFAEFDLQTSPHTFAIIRHNLEAETTRHPGRSGIRVSRRVTYEHEGALPKRIMVDLAGLKGRFVEISPEGWKVDTRLGVPFESSEPCPPFPEPEHPASPTASLQALQTLLNLERPDFLRCIAWLLAALRPTKPFPILILRGPSGSGKSTAARILRSLVDPSSAQITPTPRTSSQLLSSARQNWVLAFDQISKLTPQVSETLCRLTTGTGLSIREEGSRTPLQISLKRPILMTVTAEFDSLPDLAARAITVTLPALTPETRRAEQDILDDVHHDLTLTLGAIYDLVSTILKGPLVVHPHPTRHTDALAWATAAAPALNCTPDEMRDAFHNPAPSDPIVELIAKLLEANSEWSGTATALSDELLLATHPRALSHKLKKNVVAMNDAGIHLAFHRNKSTRLITLRRDFASPAAECPSQPPESNPLTPPPEPSPIPNSFVTACLCKADAHVRAGRLRPAKPDTAGSPPVLRHLRRGPQTRSAGPRHGGPDASHFVCGVHPP
jgi:energy-coupling factor transporter ATP-binding protein EcfA2